MGWGAITKGHEKTFEGHRYYLDWGNDFMNIYLFVKVYPLNMHSLSYINYTSIKLLKKKTTQCSITLQPTSCSLGHSSQKNEDLCSYKNLHMNVYSSFIHNNPKLEATHVSFSG